MLDLEFIVYRLIQQAVDEAVPAYWERQARYYESMPCERNNLIALACRRHAWLLRDLHQTARAGSDITDELASVLEGDEWMNTPSEQPVVRAAGRLSPAPTMDSDSARSASGSALLTNGNEPPSSPFSVSSPESLF